MSLGCIFQTISNINLQATLTFREHSVVQSQWRGGTKPHQATATSWLYNSNRWPQQAEQNHFKTRARASTLHCVNIFIAGHKLSVESDTNNTSVDIPFHMNWKHRCAAEVLTARHFLQSAWHFQMAKIRWWTQPNVYITICNISRF